MDASFPYISHDFLVPQAALPLQNTRETFDFSEKEQKEINDKVEKSYRILQKREIEDRKEREAKLMEIRKKNMESMEKIRRGEKRWKRGY